MAIRMNGRATQNRGLSCICTIRHQSSSLRRLLTSNVMEKECVVRFPDSNRMKIMTIHRFKLAPLFGCFVAAVLSGCATDWTGYARNGEFDKAYENLEYNLLKGAVDVSRAQAMVKEYPQITTYGFNTFSMEKLQRWANQVGEMEAHKRRVVHFCRIASGVECKQAMENIAEVENGIKERLLVVKEIYSQLSGSEKSFLDRKFAVRLIGASEIGSVIDKQTQNVSTPGSNAGSVLGAAVGSAAYVDKAFSGNPSNWNYSAKGHLGAQVAGVVIGGVVGNAKPEELYRIRYTIRARNGNVQYIDSLTGSPLGHSIGVCLQISDLTLIDELLCKINLSEFKQKYILAN